MGLPILSLAPLKFCQHLINDHLLLQRWVLLRDGSTRPAGSENTAECSQVGSEGEKWGLFLYVGKDFYTISQQQQVGNSVPPVLAMEIALTIKKMMKDDKQIS